MIFPVNKTTQTRYSFELDSSSQFMRVLVPDFQSARIIARRINRIRTSGEKPPVFPWQVAAHAIQFFLMDYIVRQQVTQDSASMMAVAKGFLQNIQPEILVEISGKIQAEGKSNHGFDKPGNPLIIKEYLPLFNEIILRSIAFQNPANSDFKEFITFFELNEKGEEADKLQTINDSMAKIYGHQTQNSELFQLLFHPFQATDQYLDQLELIQEKWGPYIGPYNLKLMNVTRFIRDELSQKRQRFPGVEYQFSTVPTKQPYQEEEWMQKAVLIAKNTPVWLGQLAKKYHKPVQKLDEIPDEEFMFLKSMGINALWLIGIWERSPASGKIKTLYGNTQAIASAYSIFRYRIAPEFGGPEALDFFLDQAHAYGFYVGCDMVPNHTGIDSPWVINHPEWFIYSQENPRNEFSFNSPDLSSDEKAGIFLEEGYYTQSGAAEVFRYDSKAEPKEYFIYHGNDGTSMPWNDTAQLNYLNPQARSAVMEIIQDLAAKFDIIRFDAAMTLTRQHFKRLWFPDEQTSDHIPTRESARMSQTEFDSHMPHEFWLEVTADLKKHQRNTLLIAEAFWLMEDFFINELGMHRVYNSAFMNLLRDEENAQFSDYLKNILKSDPLVLERFVNYLTTPDEMSAAEQFGTAEKYFGMCTLLATMPGLPMIGHGQIEGFSERYGMDFMSSLWDEAPSESLMDAHNKWIAPLLCQRDRFSKASHFLLIEIEDLEGMVADDVIGFVNQVNGQNSMVLFNNCPDIKEGSAKYGTGKFNLNRTSLERRLLASCLISGVGSDKNFQFTEMRTKDSLLVNWRSFSDHGFSFKLNPYQSLVYDIAISDD